MRIKVIWSFLSLMALGTGGLLTGCDSDAKIAKSSAGESCDKTSDCNDNLKCIDGTCYKSAASAGGSANNGDGGDGPGVIGPPEPVLGGEGESCARRADCEDGLACLSQRCQKDADTGMAGEGNTPGPALGRIGETCGLTSDCEAGLACLPSNGIVPAPVDTLAIGSNSVGVCTPVNNGLAPTGNVCGAECKTAADCCELPVAVHAPYAVATPYGTGANSCTQLAALLEDVKCASTTDATDLARCFAQAAYCDCGAKTWACNEAGRCEYTAACVANTVGPVPGGCPTYTRTQTGDAAAVTCNKAKKCAPEPTTGCEADSDCDATVAVAGSDVADVCSEGKCVCDTDTGSCYRGCSEDLDCPVHFACDTKASLCRKVNECETSSFCVTAYNDINSKCIGGMCQSSCNNDLDCNGGQLTASTQTMVCNADHVCEMVGCESDDQCSAVGGVRTFCTKAPEPMAVGGVISAVTD